MNFKPNYVTATFLPSLGLHYWPMSSVDMPCEDAYPMFLLYNNGRLNALGWAFQTLLEEPIYEHPRNQDIGVRKSQYETVLRQLV